MSEPSKKLTVKKVFIAGGIGVLSTGIEKGLKKYSLTRFAGKDRFETSQKINKQAVPKAARAFLATGLQFLDALAGAALAKANKAPLYVVQPTCIPTGVLPRTPAPRGGAGHPIRWHRCAV